MSNYEKLMRDWRNDLTDAEQRGLPQDEIERIVCEIERLDKQGGHDE